MIQLFFTKPKLNLDSPSCLICITSFTKVSPRLFFSGHRNQIIINAMDYATKPTDPEIVIGFATESLIYPKKNTKKLLSVGKCIPSSKTHTQKTQASRSKIPKPGMWKSTLNLQHLQHLLNLRIIHILNKNTQPLRSSAQEPPRSFISSWKLESRNHPSKSTKVHSTFHLQEN